MVMLGIVQPIEQVNGTRAGRAKADPDLAR